MADTLAVYVFRDPHFAPDGDTPVWIAERSEMERFIPKKVARAFSGRAVYRRWPWKTYVGVWGRKNASRLRRFLRKRGAELTIHREAPQTFGWPTGPQPTNGGASARSASVCFPPIADIWSSVHPASMKQ